MSGIGENQYNGRVHTFVSGLIVNDIWANLGSDAAGTPPVTLGTDNWFVESIPASLIQRPFFNRLGGGVTADMVAFFYKNDRMYINNLILFCNFADGLVKQSDTTVTPPTVGAVLPDYEITNDLRVKIFVYANSVANVNRIIKTVIFPVSHFNRVNDLGVFLLPDVAVDAPNILQTDRAIWVEINIESNSGNPAYSTKNINTAFQTDRCLIWAEAVISHTFSTSDHDNVIIGPTATGWPD